MSEAHGADTHQRLGAERPVGRPVFHEFEEQVVPPEWAHAAVQPPSLAEMVHESEALQLQQERRALRNQVARAMMGVQVLDAHNRVLQHLLMRERERARAERTSGHCPERPSGHRPERPSGHCPHKALAQPTASVVKCRGGKKILSELALPAPQQFTNNVDFAQRQHMLDSHDTVHAVTIKDDTYETYPNAPNQTPLIEEGTTCGTTGSGSALERPLLTRTVADPDPTDPRNCEEDSESEPMFADLDEEVTGSSDNGCNDDVDVD